MPTTRIRIATDNEKLGEVEGSYMKKCATEDSQIAIIGHVEGSSTAIDFVCLL